MSRKVLASLIKKEFILDGVNKNNVADDIPNIEPNEPPRKKLKRPKRGQNRSRAKQNRISYTVKLCPDIGKGRICKFAGKCKFSHDVDRYLKNDKAKDISNRCIIFEALGECPAGYLCRFANAHIDNNGQLIKRNNNSNNNDNKNDDNQIDEKENQNDNKLYEIIPEINLVALKDVKELSKIKPNDLRKFPITQQLMKNYKQFNDKYHPQKRKAIIFNQLQNSDNSDNNDINDQKSDNLNETTLITESNNYPLKNVFLFKDRTENDKNLLKLYNKSDNNNKLQNYYASLDLIYLEKRKFDISNKLYLAPLTTVGNLPFRRICIEYGAEITCSEMSLSTKLVRGIRGEWALFRRHSSEKHFGIQIAGGYVDTISKVIEYSYHKWGDMQYDFIDLNVGCPLDDICNKRAGAALMKIPYHLRTILRSMYSITNKNEYNISGIPITCKMRKGFMHDTPNAKEIIDVLCEDGVSAIGVHGRSRQQRYRRPADWDYITECVNVSSNRVPIIGNGDVYNYNEWYSCMSLTSCSTVMIGRGALIKPWLFSEIRSKKHIDISSSERFNMIQKYVNYGLERWGSDQRGVDLTRKFLLEWLSFLNRYIPIGILEKTIKINEAPPNTLYWICRNDLETLMASKNVNDWIKITEMFLGPVNDSNFKFIPKHKASSIAPSFVDNKNYILNDLGEIVKINNNNNVNKIKILTNTINILGKKRKFDDI